MTDHLGNVPAGSTLYIPFATYLNGASVTMSGLAVTDIEIYKNGSVTQRASDAGYALLDTDGIDFDGITGIHGFSLDLSDNTDAGFFSVGAFYWVIVSSVTVSGETVNFIAATFRIVAAESSAGVPKVDLSHINGAAQTATLDTIKAETAAIVNDTDVIDDATSGLVKIAQDVAAILVDTGTTLDGKINTIDGIVDDILVDTAVIGAAGAGLTEAGGTGDHLTAVPWNATWDAEVQSEVDDALVAQRLDELLNADSDIDGVAPPTVGSVFHELMTKTAGSFTYDQTTDSLEAVRDRGDAAWITATGFSTHSAADVWSVATRLLTAGTNIVLAKGTGVTGFNDLSAAQVNAEADTALADYDPPTNTEMAAAFTEIKGATWATTDTLEAIRDRGDSAWITATGFSTHSAADVWSVATRVLTANTNLNDPTAAAIADAVWEEAIADHSGTAGSTAEQLAAVGAAGDPWATALPGSYTSGQAGKIVGDNLNATVSSRATQTSVDTIDGIVDAIVVDTAEIGTAGAGLTNIVLPAGGLANVTAWTVAITGNVTGNLSGSVGSVTGNVGGNVTGSIGSLATQAKADVNAEADAAIETYHLDHLLAATYDPAAKPGAADALLNELIESDAGVSRYTANALEQAPSGGSAPSAADIRAEIDSNSTQLAAIVADTNELQTDWANGGRLDLILDARASQASVDTVDTVVDAIKVKTDVIPAAPAAVGDVPTAIQNADAFLNRDMATGADNGSSTVRTPRQALRFLRNKFEISAGTLTVYKEDDSTSSWTGTVTQTAGNPVSANDPSGP